MTGFIPNEQVPHYINLADICLMPYKTDTFSGKIRLPMKLFQYSSMGKPILSVQLPEVKRLKPKHVFYYNDATSFASQAFKILNNQTSMNDLNNYARKFAEKFDYSRIAKKCESILYKKLVLRARN